MRLPGLHIAREEHPAQLHPVLLLRGAVRPGATCFHRKRAACARHFGVQEELGQPGPKAKKLTEFVSIPRGGQERLSHLVSRVGACPPILHEVDEVWGSRCVPTAHRVARSGP